MSSDSSDGSRFLGKAISGPFTIPSGIVTTTMSIIQHYMDRCPQLGVLTTKSIGYEPRPGYREPVFSQYAPGCFVNAVGLTNPGAVRSAELLQELEVPEDRFLLVSIFGGSVEEFVRVAQLLAPFSDGLELNLSCPHATGYGMAMGQDPELVEEITRAVKEASALPVIPKLTPNADDIGAIAAAAVAGGADALCAINTVGPGFYSAHGHAVLSNEVGGMSGKGILPVTLKCIREIRAVTDVPIIGCGGVSSADDVAAVRDAGGDIVGIGSALTGMNSAEIVDYFHTLDIELTETASAGVGSAVRTEGDAEPRAETLVRYDVDMGFKPVVLAENRRVCEDIAILTFDRPIDIQAGEFVFLWVPGLGEKPFSALTDDPFSLVLIDVGEFTHACMDLSPGTTAYIRGPHGVAATPAEDRRIVAVAGGTGLAAVYQLVRDYGGGELFMGARTAERLYFKEESAACANLHIATDDGSEGYHGLVTQLLDEYLAQLSDQALADLEFYNCGPAPMVHAAVEVQLKHCAAHQIYSAIDYLTKCGVGICGACAAPDGRRLCVDGPFLGIASP